MKKAFLLIVLLSVVNYIGCVAYKKPAEYQVEKARAYDKTYDEVWQKAITWFAKNGTPVKNMDKGSGFISTEYNLSTSKSQDCLDCGKEGIPFMGVQKLVNQRGNFNILISKISETRTQVEVNCFFAVTSEVYFDGKLSDSRQLDCNSTGKLEKEFLDFLGSSTIVNK